MKVGLWKIAHARSGDKADRADIGLFAFDAQTYAVLKREVTRERLAAHFSALGAGPVELWPLDNILALKIVLNGDPFGDPFYADETLWYNPLVPAVVDAVSPESRNKASGRPVLNST